MESVKVGNTHFALNHLRGVTLKEAKEMFSHIDKNKVTTAYYLANPKKKKKSKK